jgi:hypothetical protein
MEDNLPNSFMGYLLEGPSSPSSQGFNISSSQGLRLKFSQVVNLSFPCQPLGLGLGLSVNASMSAPKLGVMPQIDRRLWSNGKLPMMIDLWEEKHWEYRIRQPMATKDWKELTNKINVSFLNEVSCTWT